MKHTKLFSTLFIALSILLVSCELEEKLPVIVTLSAEDVSSTSAKLNADIRNIGTPAYTVAGMCYAKHQNPTESNNEGRLNYTGGGKVKIYGTATDLTPNTTYYFRAFATNKKGTAYGMQLSFTTNSSSSNLPVVETLPVEDVTQTTATLWARVTDTGTPAYSVAGVCLSTSQNPTTNDRTFIYDGGDVTKLRAEANNLIPNTTYYYRAFATNTVGTVYGQQVNFKTLSGPSQQPQIRFKKVGWSDYYTKMGVGTVSGDYATLRAQHDFGVNSGTSNYYDFEAGTLYTMIWTGSSWYYWTNKMFEFPAGNRYRFECDDDDDNVYIDVFNEGPIFTPSPIYTGDAKFATEDNPVMSSQQQSPIVKITLPKSSIIRVNTIK